MVFDSYSKYYDLLYQDKDYIGETKYIDQLLKRFLPNAKTVLELGCGTGKHGELLAKLGYQVTGVESSRVMLAQAALREIECSDTESGSFRAVHGDARTAKVEKTFDSAISLFHVLSYQTTNEDVTSLLRTASTHLNAGGVFIFDFWFSPAVLSQKPEVRVKKLDNSSISITRIASPNVNHLNNTVVVNYEVLIMDKSTSELSVINENHLMRHFSLPELHYFCSNANLTVRHCEEWYTGRIPSSETWGVLMIAVKN